MKKLAQIDLFPEGGFQGLGTGPLSGPQGEGSVNVFANIISTAIGVMTIVAIIWFVFLLIGGAIGIMTAGGDKTAAEGARKRITSGIIGLVIVIAAIFILSLLGFLFEIDFLDVGGLFGQLFE
jgi:uncharacterized RDD family membrane protein YckC